MYYAFLLISAFLFSSQFMVSKEYQKKNGNGVKASLVLSCEFGFFATVILYLLKLVVTGSPNLDFNWISLLLAFLLALTDVFCGIFGLKTLSLGDIAVYTLFMMSGGMILPFLYGICFLGEIPTAFQIAGLILSAIALCLPVFFNKNKTKAQSIKFYFFCILLFLFNGTNATISKINAAGAQIGIYPMPGMDFVVYIYATQFVFTAALLLFSKLKNKTENEVSIAPFSKNVVVCAVLYAAINGTAFLLSVLSAENVPAVMQYPLVTGATMVFSGILGWLVHKEKLDKVQLLQIIVATAATVLFVF